jgi:hypothetical protein
MRTFAQNEPLTDAELDRLGDFIKGCKGGRVMNVEGYVVREERGMNGFPFTRDWRTIFPFQPLYAPKQGTRGTEGKSSNTELDQYLILLKRHPHRVA